ALPFAPDRIRDVEIDLRSVERAVAFVQRVVEMDARERLLQLRLRVIPGGNLAHELFGARRQLRRERQAEVTVHTLNETDEPLDLVADLLRRDEAVRIILRELANACQPRQHS